VLHVIHTSYLANSGKSTFGGVSCVISTAQSVTRINPWSSVMLDGTTWRWRRPPICSRSVNASSSRVRWWSAPSRPPSSSTRCGTTSSSTPRTTPSGVRSTSASSSTTTRRKRLTRRTARPCSRRLKRCSETSTRVCGRPRPSSLAALVAQATTTVRATTCVPSLPPTAKSQSAAECVLPTSRCNRVPDP